MIKFDPQMPVKQRDERPGLVLGCAQLGMSYGRNNRTGMLSDDDANALLDCAAELGVTQLDTARAYGSSEQRIGTFLAAHPNMFRILTKLDPLASLRDDAARHTVEGSVDASISASCCNLRLEQLDTVLLHRASHLHSHHGAIISRLSALQRQGVIRRLGCSVQNPDELRQALAKPEVSHIQLPYNVLDRRWEHHKSNLAMRPDVTIHVRSALLQGVLASDDPLLWPDIADFDAQETIRKLKQAVALFGRADLADFGLAAVRSRSWVDGLVVGVDNVEQLKRNAQLFRRPPLSDEQFSALLALLPSAPPALTDPSKWPPPCVKSGSERCVGRNQVD